MTIVKVRDYTVMLLIVPIAIQLPCAAWVPRLCMMLYIMIHLYMVLIGNHVQSIY